MEGVEELIGSTWQGHKRLWMDSDGPPLLCDAEITLEDGVVRYGWSYEGKAQQGEVAWERGEHGVSATFRDSWHQPSPMACAPVGGPALVAVQGSYAAPPGPDWHWRILLYVRPAGPYGPAEPQLVIQMINVYPLGRGAAGRGDRGDEAGDVGMIGECCPAGRLVQASAPPARSCAHRSSTS